jgi:hypothetical protein
VDNRPLKVSVVVRPVAFPDNTEPAVPGRPQRVPEPSTGLYADPIKRSATIRRDTS